MMRKIRMGPWLLLLLPLAASAEVYRWTDQQGRLHYSDRGHDAATVVNIDPGVSYYTVEKVFDGDTILLSNDQKVRFLGINTPEVAGRNKSAESGGEQAKAWLKNKLENRKVSLQGDVEKQDKYQRTLAYVFTEDKQHVNVELVRRGLATVNIYPPNLRYVDALLAAQREAERAGLGIWADPAYEPVPAATLSEENYHGWKRITGRVEAVRRTAKHSYLQMSDSLAVDIDLQFVTGFPALENYVGKRVEARGWLKRSKGRFTMPIKHPGDLVVLP